MNGAPRPQDRHVRTGGRKPRNGEKKVTEERIGGQCSGGGLRACWASDIGRVRENNEDSVLAMPEGGLFALSDGMGGEHAGELASRLVIERLPALVAERFGGLDNAGGADVEAALQDAALALNECMREQSAQLGPAKKMGATVVMALVRGHLAYVAHMGDSRAYLLHNGTLERLTLDHSVVGILESRAAISSAEAKRHPMRGQLLRYVGMAEGARADVRTVKLKDGDWLMLCSDGLTDGLNDEHIERVMVRCDGINTACQALVGTARSTDGRDNITVLIAERSVQ